MVVQERPQLDAEVIELLRILVEGSLFGELHVPPLLPRPAALANPGPPPRAGRVPVPSDLPPLNEATGATSSCSWSDEPEATAPAASLLALSRETSLSTSSTSGRSSATDSSRRGVGPLGAGSLELERISGRATLDAAARLVGNEFDDLLVLGGCGLKAPPHEIEKPDGRQQAPRPTRPASTRPGRTSSRGSPEEPEFR